MSVKLEVYRATLEAMLAQADAFPWVETGFRLLGKVYHREGGLSVVIHSIIEAGTDAEHGAAVFVQGSQEQQQALEWFYTHFGLEYVGEGHTHFGLSRPSGTDGKTAAAMLAREGMERLILLILDRENESWNPRWYMATTGGIESVEAEMLDVSPSIPVSQKDKRRQPWYLRSPALLAKKLKGLESRCRVAAIPVNDGEISLCLVLKGLNGDDREVCVLVPWDYPRRPAVVDISDMVEIRRGDPFVEAVLAFKIQGKEIT